MPSDLTKKFEVFVKGTFAHNKDSSGFVRGILKVTFQTDALIVNKF